VTRDTARTIVAEVLHRIAPEVDVDDVDPQGDLQEEMDLDSMDFLNLVVGLHGRTGVEIPEHDYPLVSTLDGCVTYLAEHMTWPLLEST
jgi:acyl carrier protein